MDNISLVLADDHPLLLEGLYTALKSKGFNILGKANDGSSVLKLINELNPQIAILDIEMPQMDGLSVAKYCMENGYETKFIILSYHKETEFIARAKSLNLSGYLLKEDALVEIELCIQKVMAGEQYYSKAFHLKDVSKAQTSLDRLESLTPSERKILKLIAVNRSTREIADILFISERTVEKHRSNIIQKLDLNGKLNGLITWVLHNKHLLN
ncbi:response regulator [Roseivirga echinicomitans]